MNGALPALLFMAAGMAMSMLRAAPGRVGAALADLFTISITVDEREAVDLIGSWLAAQPYGLVCRRLKLSVKWRNLGLGLEEEGISRVELAPGEGPHLFRHHGRWVILWRGEHRNEYSDRTTTTLYLRTLGRDRAWLEALVREAVDFGVTLMRERELVRVNGDDGYWQKLEVGSGRPLESVVLPGDERQRIADDLRRFLAAREGYARRGVPYRRGYLFLGPPGTGKTSLARALAHELGLTLYVLDLSSARTSDQQLFSLLAQVPTRSMVLVEDVDRTRPVAAPGGACGGEAAAGMGGVTMSGLLNAVDGPLAGEGRVLVFTTNHPEKLDPALLRPGRVDYRVEFGAADARQARELFLRFFPGEEAAAAAFAAGLEGQALTAADLQGALLTAESAAEAVRASLTRSIPELECVSFVSGSEPVKAADRT